MSETRNAGPLSRAFVSPFPFAMRARRGDAEREDDDEPVTHIGSWEEPRVMHEERIKIRWRDMDAYGHVNNGVYLNFLEEARDRWVQEVLGSVADTWDFVLARVAIDFRTELKQDDGEVLVRCRLDSIGRSSIRTREEILRFEGSLSAEARSVIVPRDPSTGRSRPLTNEERAVLEAELAADPAG
jgi:acyl-CoA thioester hydrolase